MNSQDLARFESKIELIPFSSCWHWIAARSGNGYGAFRLGRKQMIAHRASYEHYIGEIPRDLQIDHICENKGCVNPKHLEAVTPRQNTMRSTQHPRHFYGAKMCCPKGHEYSETNTYSNGISRQCKTCRYETHKAFVAANPEKVREYKERERAKLRRSV